MTILDWLIIILPVCFVMWTSIYSRRYLRDVSDYMSAGRVCGRYVISVADVANGLSIITLVAYVEVQYKTGFAITFWNSTLSPLMMVLGLTGYCFYRWRETRAMSLGQFLEMRYSRSFRIFAAALRSISEMLANMICPAIAARFFIYFFGWPHTLTIAGIQIPTFILVVVVVLTLAISIICMGGTLALVITDTIQGLFCYPMLVVFTVFVLVKFNFTEEIVPVMMDRIQGESFLNPYDIEHLRDFNLFALIVTIVVTFLHRASWIGAGNTSAARTPHEQKMANVLGTFRTGFSTIFYILMALTLITLLNHKNFSGTAMKVKQGLITKISEELVADKGVRDQLREAVVAIPEIKHQIGIDPPLSQDSNLDTPYLNATHQVLGDTPQGNKQYQEFRTLYHQLMLPLAMRELLPTGMLGLFCLMMVLMMVSTDDSRIMSAAMTITQDVILPFKKGGFTTEQHVRVLRFVAVGVGVFFLIGSYFMAQLDYINLFVTITTSIWLGGCGPVMVFGLYSRFGTTAGAWASLLSGMVTAITGIIFQRTWAAHLYPWLAEHNLVDFVDKLLQTLSRPMDPWVVWKMNAVKFPINSNEWYLFTMVFTFIVYCVVSKLTCKKPFNLDRMLHRGIYNTSGETIVQEPLTWRNAFKKLIGITSEYSKGDRIIAWAIFLYSFGWSFCTVFLGANIWNAISPWSTKAWGWFFYVVYLIVPGIIAAISTVWFTIGGAIDLKRLFRDLKTRTINTLDDGRVEGEMSLADAAALKAAEAKKDAE